MIHEENMSVHDLFRDKTGFLETLTEEDLKRNE